MPKTITLFENLRAVPYTPFYLAIARGDWTREGIDVRVETSPAMSQTAEALLDGRADVSWGGPMRVMTYHDKDPECPLVCFGQVVARDPFILVGREPNKHFRFQDLAGLKVAVAEEAPTPWLTFQDDLGRAGFPPDRLKRTPDQPMADNVAALRAGELDVVQVFEPYAEQLVTEGAGHIWHRFAERGDIAYTSFYTTKAFAKRQRKTCRALVRGIGRAQIALHSTPANEVAKAIREFFPELTQRRLSRMISGYRKSGLWAKTPALPPEAFTRLKAALLSGELIERDVPYNNAVDARLSNTKIDDL
ncbi:MAG: ABC transporter substrate-binding protein [Alphaproteobacteria bacterium]|nr:ABC transporter substrate-binding protein [Alphaproteobacteria bacterium]